MINKLFILYRAIVGKLIVCCYKLKILKFPEKALNESKRDYNIIVSLTTYGRRLERVAPFAIISMMKQTIKPDKIILNIDAEKWKPDNLPNVLKCLSEKGLVINYVRDIRSYTKLIPTLKKYCSDIIITIDDDIIYSKYLIENLYNSFLNNPHSISSMRTPGDKTYQISIKDNKYLFRSNHLMGTGGVLYPPDSLPIETFDEERWQKFAPTDDDIWFFMMGLKNGFDTIKVKQIKSSINYDFDVLYQFFHKGSRLKDHLNISNAITDIIREYDIDLLNMGMNSLKGRIVKN